MFIILGLLVFPSQLKAVVIRGSILAIMITIVARMAVVFALMSPFKYTKKEKFFMSWAGLKGAVPIIFSTNAITAGIDNSQVIFNMVFYMVVFSVMIQGMTLKPLAKYLGLLDPVSEADADTIDLEELEELSLKKLYLDRKSEYINKEIRELNLPKSMHIISIRRGEEDIIPRGDVILKAGDKILFSMK
jgi:cell volume regulation protein A